MARLQHTRAVDHAAGDGNDCSALLGFRSDPIEYDFWDLDAQRALVIAAFSDDTAWQVPEVTVEIPGAEDFSFDAVAQIKMPGSGRGRVALVGTPATAPRSSRGWG
jgi:hypothetical protein